MSDPSEGMMVWMRDLHRIVVTSAVDASNRLATWLVIGNTGALALAYNGLLQGTECDLWVMRSAATWFGAGLAFAFLGAVVSLGSSLVTITYLSRSITSIDTVRLNEHYIQELEDDGIELSEDSPLKAEQSAAAANFQKVAKAEARSRWVGPSISMLLFAASCTAFVGGVAAPIAKPQVFESCAKASGHSKPLADAARRR